MGWASFQEDIVDRWAGAIHDLRAHLPAIERSGVDCQALRGWIARAEQILADVREHLDLATDPTVRAIDDLAEAYRLNQQLREDLARIRVENERLRVAERDSRAKLHEAQAALEKAHAELKAAAKDKRRTERRVQEAMKLNPSAMYDAYSTPDRIKRLKSAK